MGNAYTISVRIRGEKRLLSKPFHGWENNIKLDLTEIAIELYQLFKQNGEGGLSENRKPVVQKKQHCMVTCKSFSLQQAYLPITVWPFQEDLAPV
jgi:hypothetical protein